MLNRLIVFLCRHCKHMSTYTFYAVCDTYGRRDYTRVQRAVNIWNGCRALEESYKARE